jgi:hypothetical protein
MLPMLGFLIIPDGLQCNLSTKKIFPNSQSSCGPTMPEHLAALSHCEPDPALQTANIARMHVTFWMRR